MELGRPKRPPSVSSTASDLFICFTSRLSHSSSMRMSSKSILSPGRNGKPPISLSASRSRRLRSNNGGSLRGGQSPMFPPGVNSKKRGCAFENPEPSSPKVTCIGQVRVKTKKQGKKMKMNMKAYRTKKITATKATTICDAFSCFNPCRLGEGEKGEKGANSSSSCYRWFVALNGGGEGKTRNIKMVLDEEEGKMKQEREFSRRRSIFDDMDFNVDEICEGGRDMEGSRVRVCVPPKNALLLMRCRSDPVKMSALVNKFLESHIKEEVEEVEEIEEKKRISVREDEKIEAFSWFDDQKLLEGKDEEKEESFIENQEGEEESNGGLMNLAMLFEEEDDPDENFGQSHDPPDSTPPLERQEEDPVEIQETVVGKDSIFEHIEEEDDSQLPPLESQDEEEEKWVAESQSRSEEEEHFEAMEKPVLPDCLLLMMREPKLSMEVSKETWVCSTDFLQPWLPERHRQHQLKKLTGAGDEPSNNQKKNQSKNKNRGFYTESRPPLPPPPAIQPPRSSCSFPISMTSLIEKKLVSTIAYEPFVLTRCKSEPMRTASANLGPLQEVACCWKSSKIEPHRPATSGVGTVGVGF